MKSRGIIRNAVRMRKFGKTGLEVSEIGFGAWGIGGSLPDAVGYGPTLDSESKKALRRAFELGINFYDTADLYGFGHSENLLGETFEKERTKVLFASKTGFLNSGGLQDFSISHLTKSLQASLKRLRTDYLDLYQLHNPSVELLRQKPEILEWLFSMKKKGSVRFAGISLRSPDDGLAVVKDWDVDFLQVNFSMIDQRAYENGLLDLCLEKGTGFIGRTPLCFGFLSGAYSGEAQFDAADHRSRWSSEQIRLWSQAAKLFAGTAQSPGQTQVQRALRYCLSYPGLSTVIPGMLTPSQVDENAAAGESGPLPKEERQAIEAVYRNHSFFVKKENPSVSLAKK